MANELPPSTVRSEYWIPQEMAAAVKIGLDIGSTVLIGCRPPESAPSKIELLSNREYEVLHLTVQSLSRQETADRLKITPGTVKDHLYNSYTTLRTKHAGKGKAGTFIPISEDRLRSIRLHTWDAEGKLEPILNECEQRIWELTGNQLTNNDISFILGISPKTVRNYKARMSRKLGINTTQGRNEGEMPRIAGALKNLEQYATIVQDVAYRLQPAILGLTAKLNNKIDQSNININYRSVVRLKDPEILQELSEGAFITREERESGKLSLAGYIGLCLMQHPETQSIIQDKITRPIARTVIAEETRHYLRQQQ